MGARQKPHTFAFDPLGQPTFYIQKLHIRRARRRRPRACVPLRRTAVTIHELSTLFNAGGRAPCYNARMTVFTYSATTRAGVVSRGERAAENEKVLAENLKQEGLLLLNAQERSAAASVAHIDIKATVNKILPIPLSEKMFFARNLSVMIAAGLSLDRALTALADQTTNAKFKAVIADVNGAVRRGTSFADALRPHQDVFGELFVNMAEVGEATGKLALVLKLVANQIKRDGALRARVRGAMMYPAIILVALGGVGALMMIYVIPTLSATIKELGVPLPLSTRIVIGTSDFIMNQGLATLGIVAALAAVAWYVRRLEAVKTFVGRSVLKLPIFGPLVRKFNTARFCRTLAYLGTSGVPIVRSLEITSRVVSNVRFRAVIRETAEEVKKGVQIHTLLARHPDVFQPLVTEMIAVGEETGKISEMLLRLALFFEEEVAQITRNLSTIVEPLLMIVIGIIVGVFAISVLQPIYSSLGSIGV